MKKFLYPLVLMLAVGLVSTTTDEQRTATGDRVVATMKMNGDEVVLELPEVLDNYSDVDIPDHYSFYEEFASPSNPGASEITDAGATLGRVLFYDRNLSQNRTVSCGSCHQQSKGFADPVQFSEGFDGVKGNRNALSIADIGFAFYPALFWDDREVDLEHMVLLPLLDGKEMGITLEEAVERVEESDYYPDLFAAAFGDSEVTSERMGSAMAQFIASFKVVNTELDRVILENDWTPELEAGRELFKSHCFSCHSTVVPEEGAIDFVPSLPFFNSLIGPHNTGLYLEYGEDQGVGNETGSPTDNGKFKTPSLKNVALTGPYMHDGSLETLEDVIDFYSDEVQPHPNSTFNSQPYYSPLDLPQPFVGFDLDDVEKANLLVFLESLTDEEFITDPKFSDPFRVVESGVGVNDAEANGLSVFPNPMSVATTVQSEDPQDKIYTIRIIDSAGKVVVDQLADASTYTIERGSLPSGIYLMKIWSDNGISSEKLIIE